MYVTETTRIEDVFKRLLDAHVHRVWVVDGDKRPIGVITMSDLIGHYFK